MECGACTLCGAKTNVKRNATNFDCLFLIHRHFVYVMWNWRWRSTMAMASAYVRCARTNRSAEHDKQSMFCLCIGMSLNWERTNFRFIHRSWFRLWANERGPDAIMWSLPFYTGNTFERFECKTSVWKFIVSLNSNNLFVIDFYFRFALTPFVRHTKIAVRKQKESRAISCATIMTVDWHFF